MSVLLMTPPASATDEPDELMGGTAVHIRPLNLISIRSEPGSYDLPDPSNDPTIEGGTLRIFDMVPGGDDETYSLPAANWTAIGGGEYDYQSPQANTSPDSPCSDVSLRGSEIQIRCVGTGITLTPPFAGDVGVILTIGTGSKRYCLQFGGTTSSNNSRRIERFDAPAPAACPTPPPPLPELLPGKVTLIKPLLLAKFVSRPLTATESFDLPSYPVNPVNTGAVIRFRDTGGTGGDVTYNLPASRWEVSGRSGFKYRGTGDPGNPCSVVIIKKRVIKGVCRNTDVTLTPGPTFTGDVAIRLTTGTGPTMRYCAQFRGSETSNTAELLRRKDAPAPTAAECPSPSGAFVESAREALFD